MESPRLPPSMDGLGSSSRRREHDPGEAAAALALVGRHARAFVRERLREPKGAGPASHRPGLASLSRPGSQSGRRAHLRAGPLPHSAQWPD
jgi:hypothetical protein